MTFFFCFWEDDAKFVFEQNSHERAAETRFFPNHTESSQNSHFIAKHQTKPPSSFFGNKSYCSKKPPSLKKSFGFWPKREEFHAFFKLSSFSQQLSFLTWSSRRRNIFCFPCPSPSSFFSPTRGGLPSLRSPYYFTCQVSPPPTLPC